MRPMAAAPVLMPAVPTMVVAVATAMVVMRFVGWVVVMVMVMVMVVLVLAHQCPASVVAAAPP
jgi:hypothetical protein